MKEIHDNDTFGKKRDKNRVTFQSFEQELQATVPEASWGIKLFPR
jgi:hypothetical protein